MQKNPNEEKEITFNKVDIKEKEEEKNINLYIRQLCTFGT